MWRNNKSTRYAAFIQLFKRPENLTVKQETRLAGLLRYNLRSVRAYLLKEEFQFFWSHTSPYWAGWFLDKWCTKTMRSKVDPMKKVARKLRQLPRRRQSQKRDAGQSVPFAGLLIDIIRGTLDSWDSGSCQTTPCSSPLDYTMANDSESDEGKHHEAQEQPQHDRR